MPDSTDKLRAQVNPEFSTAVSWEGNNDKTTLDKDVLAIVTASFALN